MIQLQRQRSHTGLPHFVTAPGEYLTRCGEKVTVTKVYKRFAYGFYNKPQIRESWNLNGRILLWTETDNDIISIVTNDIPILS